MSPHFNASLRALVRDGVFFGQQYEAGEGAVVVEVGSREALARVLVRNDADIVTDDLAMFPSQPSCDRFSRAFSHLCRFSTVLFS